MAEHTERLTARCTVHPFVLSVRVDTALVPEDAFDTESSVRPAVVPDDALDGDPACPFDGCEDNVVLEREVGE